MRPGAAHLPLAAALVAALAAWLGPLSARAGEVPPDDLQRGLFLQHTLGELDGALAAYAAALEGLPPGPATDALRLRRAECLAWRGDGAGVAEALGPLRQRAVEGGAEAALLGLPAGVAAALAIDLGRLRATPWGGELVGEALRALERALGSRPGLRLTELRRVLLALELTEGERALDGWLLSLEGGLERAAPAELLALGLAAWQALEPRLRSAPGPALELASLAAAAARVSPAAREDVDGVELLLAPSGRAGADGRPERLGVARVGQGSLLLGEEGLLRRALRSRAGTSLGLLGEPRMLGLARRVHAEAAFFLLAAPQPLAAQARRLDVDLGGAAFGLSGLLLEGRAGDALGLRAVAFAEDAESVRILGDLARGALALLRLATGSEPGLPEEVRGLLAGLAIGAEERALTLELGLPAAWLARLSGR